MLCVGVLFPFHPLIFSPESAFSHLVTKLMTVMTITIKFLFIHMRSLVSLFPNCHFLPLSLNFYWSITFQFTIPSQVSRVITLVTLYIKPLEKSKLVMIPYLRLFNWTLLVLINVFIRVAFQGFMNKVITGITMTQKDFLISIYYLSLGILMSSVFFMKG